MYACVFVCVLVCVYLCVGSVDACSVRFVCMRVLRARVLCASVSTCSGRARFCVLVLVTCLFECLCTVCLRAHLCSTCVCTCTVRVLNFCVVFVNAQRTLGLPIQRGDEVYPKNDTMYGCDTREITAASRVNISKSSAVIISALSSFAATDSPFQEAL